MDQANVPLDDDILPVIKSHACFDDINTLVLNRCNVTNQIIEEIAKRIKARLKPVKIFIVNYTRKLIFQHFDH